MRRIVLAILTVSTLIAAGWLSVGPAPTAADSNTEFTTRIGPTNPWTKLDLNSEPDRFRFALVSDRTGKHRPGVFSKAIEQINILKPDFVMSVGDLIEGGPDTAESRPAQWNEFNGFVRQLKMPFFYVPGNHDVLTEALRGEWETRYGRRYYHFSFRDVLFVVLDTSDGPQGPPKKGGRVPYIPGVGEAQRAYLKKALAEVPNPRWTFVFAHMPLWLPMFGEVEANGWKDVEDLLAGRKYTVFSGHRHHYRKYVRNGMNYYQLATTGGGSQLRGVEYGEFDQIGWVTVDDNGPTLANLMLDGILKEDLTPASAGPEAGFGAPEDLSEEEFVPVEGTVVRAGKPVLFAEVCFTAVKGTRKQIREAYGLTGATGSFRMVSAFGTRKGVVPGEYIVWLRPKTRSVGNDPEPTLPEKYTSEATSLLRVTVSELGNSKLQLVLDE